MSDYGLNFGFLRSDESSRSAAEGRFKTPVGSALALGSLVEIDPASAGFMKQSAANAAILTGYTGLLLQELDFERSIYESEAGFVDSFMKGVAKGGRLSVITSGAGTKIWLRNTGSSTRADGRVIAARSLLVSPAAMVVGDELGWNGTAWVKTADVEETPPAMKVTAVNAAQLRVEAVLIK